MGTRSSRGANSEHSADESELKRKVEAGSQDAKDYDLLAELLYSSDRFEEFMGLLEKALRLPLTDIKRGKTSIEYGWLSYGVGREDEGLSWAKAGLRLLPVETDDAVTVLFRGMGQSLVAHCVSFEDVDAGTKAARLGLQDLEQALEPSPAADLARLAFAEAAKLHLLLERYEDVIRCCKNCLQLQPAEPQRLDCLVLLGSALSRTGDLVEARRVLEEALHEVAPREDSSKGFLPKIHLELGGVELDAERYDEARIHLRSATKALRLFPELNQDHRFLMNINVHLAAACFQLGEHQEAIRACDQVIAKGQLANPDHWEALVWRGNSYLELSDYSQARSSLEDALESTVTTPESREFATDGLDVLHWRQGQSFYNSEEFGGAASEFEALLSLHTEDTEDRSRYLLWLGHCRTGLGEERQARECYEAVLAAQGATEKQKELAREALEKKRLLPAFLRKWIQ